MSPLRRLPNSRFSEVRPTAWLGQRVVILGGGPSLTLQQVRLVEMAHKLEHVRCAAVNDAYLLAPWADLHYAADSKWHRWHTEGVAKPVLSLTAEQVRSAWARFAGQKCTIENSGGNVQDDAVHVLRNLRFPNHCTGLSTNQQALATGRSSGAQAINLSTLAGSRLIILLGFDAREGQPQSHWHGGHPSRETYGMYDQFRRGFTAMQEDLNKLKVRVINCSPNTAITAFERAALTEELLGMTEVVA